MIGAAPSRTVAGGTALRSTCGRVVPLDVEHWRRVADDTERDLLAELVAPVMDVGCGPGRLVEALASEGRMAMGVDTSPVAGAEASRRGAAVLTRSVFDPLPGENRWRSVVLLDGNIGIGGDPTRLLRRVGELLLPGGRVLVEVGAPGSLTDRLTVRIEADGVHGEWFPWALVSADRIGETFDEAGFDTETIECRGDRWFATGARA